MGALDGLGVAVADTALGDRLTYRSAIISGQAVSEPEPGGKAAQEIAALGNENTSLWEGIHEQQPAIVA